MWGTAAGSGPQSRKGATPATPSLCAERAGARSAADTLTSRTVVTGDVGGSLRMFLPTSLCVGDRGAIPASSLLITHRLGDAVPLATTASVRGVGGASLRLSAAVRTSVAHPSVSLPPPNAPAPPPHTPVPCAIRADILGADQPLPGAADPAPWGTILLPPVLDRGVPDAEARRGRRAALRRRRTCSILPRDDSSRERTDASRVRAPRGGDAPLRRVNPPAEDGGARCLGSRRFASGSCATACERLLAGGSIWAAPYPAKSPRSASEKSPGRRESAVIVLGSAVELGSAAAPGPSPEDTPSVWYGPP